MAGSSDDDSFLRAVAKAPDRQPEEPPPERLAQFRIVERIGKGGMGVVYRAVDEKLGRDVALKVLPSAFERDEERRRRFLREARAAAAVTHPNLITVHEIDEAGGRIFIAMELVGGQSLRQRLAESKPALDEALRIFREIARGVAKAHERGIVHRDLKPDNVMLTGDGGVKVLDFGLAKQGTADLEHADTQTNEGRIVGTPEYMSPEQAAGRAVDARSDVFSLGVILYELSAGQRPFRGTSAMDVLVSVARDEPPPPRVSRELQAAIARCLAKDPARRYAHAGELAAALEQLPLRRKSRGAVIVGGALAIAALASVALVALPRLAHHGAPASTTPPATSPILVTDSSPMPKSHEVATAWAAAMQAIRDGSLVVARRELMRAIKADPSFAAGHLHLALWMPRVDDVAPVEERRKHLAVARSGRTSLGEREAGMLPVADAMLVSDPPDWNAAADRAAALAAAHPRDSYLALFAGLRLWDAGRTQAATEAYERAIALDPRLAAAYDARALQSFVLGDLDGSLAAATRCLEISPTAGSCLQDREDIYQMRGQCAELEKESHHAIAVDPGSAEAYTTLSFALGAREAPVESLREASNKSTALTDASEAPRAALEVELKLAVYSGDFVRAEQLVGEMEKAVAVDASESTHSLQTIRLLRIHGETGESKKALRVAESYARRSAAWSMDDTQWVRSDALAVRRRNGAISEEEFVRERDRWAAEARAVRPVPYGSAVWYDAYARPVVNGREAAEALALFPKFQPRSFGQLQDAGALGRVMFFAGRNDEALSALRVEARSCGVFIGVASMIDYIRDRVFLGQALEKQGDSRGACNEYRYVLRRWEHARPRSLSAQTARARIKALGCK